MHEGVNSLCSNSILQYRGGIIDSAYNVLLSGVWK